MGDEHNPSSVGLADGRLELAVLLVEDNDGDASLVMVALQEAAQRVNVTRVRSLEAAQAALARRSYDCILVDLGLPDADGLEAVDAFAADRGGSALVVLTGLADDSVGVQAIQRGADDYLLKNEIDTRSLRRAINYAVQRTRAHEERRRADAHALTLSAIVESTADAVYTEDLEGHVLTWNRGAEVLYGYTAEDITGRHISLLDPGGGADDEAILTSIAAGETVRGIEVLRRRRDGSEVAVSLSASPVFGPDEAVVAAALIARDITERRHLEEQLRKQSLHDSLTELPNRTLLQDRLAQALARSVRRGIPVAVLFLDIDRFKDVNDAKGHVAGDELLVEVARRLLEVVRTADTVARFGGDEFAIVCDDTGAREAEDVARRISAALGRPVLVTGGEVSISASVGIAVAPPLDRDPSALLKYADAAMYDAKARGRNRYSIFDVSLAKQSGERVQLTSDLREALGRGALEVHYQPVVDVHDGRLVGVEALCRWQHPLHGQVPPALFVPLAEQSGMAAELDLWVLRRACLDAARMSDAGVLPDGCELAVNLSARNVSDLSLVDSVLGAVDAAGWSLAFLELEVTETGLLTDPEAARKVLQELRGQGVGIALDDFGTGYSSLTYLRQLPVTTIKIDRSFIQHILDRPDDRAITSSVIDLARTVGLRTVAEGVENVEQLALLQDFACDAAQGYLWSPALAPPRLATFIADHPEGFVTDDVLPGVRRTGRRASDASNRTTVTAQHGAVRMRNMHKEGASLATIAASLNRDGFRTPSGLRWHPSIVARALSVEMAGEVEEAAT